MAVRLNKHHSAETSWRFYVYALRRDGVVVYVGKGSGRRLQAQMRRYAAEGFELARFRRERDAYAFERECIAEHRPVINRHAGGNGSRATVRRPFVDRFARELEKVGRLRYCARLLLSLPSTVELNRPALREVANGPWC